MLLRDFSQLLTYEALETIHRHETPMQAAIGHILAQTAQSLQKREGFKPPLKAPVINALSVDETFNTMIHPNAPLTEKAIQHITPNEDTILDGYDGV